MSHETDRIAVPTNGKRPHPVPAAPPLTPEPPPSQPMAAFTPTQLAVGFGIVAAIVALVAGSLRRRGRGRRRGPFGGR
jgi:hypothetical protein